jgi:hypothetical protein
MNNNNFVHSSLSFSSMASVVFVVITLANALYDVHLYILIKNELFVHQTSFKMDEFIQICRLEQIRLKTLLEESNCIFSKNENINYFIFIRILDNPQLLYEFRGLFVVITSGHLTEYAYQNEIDILNNENVFIQSKSNIFLIP